MTNELLVGSEFATKSRTNWAARNVERRLWPFIDSVEASPDGSLLGIAVYGSSHEPGDDCPLSNDAISTMVVDLDVRPLRVDTREPFAEKVAKWLRETGERLSRLATEISQFDDRATCEQVSQLIESLNGEVTPNRYLARFAGREVEIREFDSMNALRTAIDRAGYVMPRPKAMAVSVQQIDENGELVGKKLTERLRFDV